MRYHHVFASVYVLLHMILNDAYRASGFCSPLQTFSEKSNAPRSTPTVMMQSVVGIRNDEKSSCDDSFVLKLDNVRPRPNTPLKKLQRLWNDPRPVGVAIRDNSYNDDDNNDNPYCIQSELFELEPGFNFRVLLYPEGRVGLNNAASVYLSFEPTQFGDEIDLSWSLSLFQRKEGEPEQLLSVSTSGGLPRSDTIWSSSMTFCHPGEAVESLGRVYDWGSSIWSSAEVCNSLGNIYAKLQLTVHDTRHDQTSLSGKGAIGAFGRAIVKPEEKVFTAGQVIVPVFAKESENDQSNISLLRKAGVVSGVDYRIMNMSDKDGNSLFSTDLKDGSGNVQIALRPCGWKSQRQLALGKGVTPIDWPAQVDSQTFPKLGVYTRFDILQTAFPRTASAFARDTLSLSLAVLLALTPLAATLVARSWVSFYAIPSASMSTTLVKGDLLLVEKLPNIYERTNRGDIILFTPPSALRDIINKQSNQGPGAKSAIDNSALFVKRVVGMPGDTNIHLDRILKEITINGESPVGPNRRLCDDEPLNLLGKLLDKYVSNDDIEKLGDDEVYVLGDCQAVSVDSRVFGTLPKKNMVGKPLARVWPLNRFHIGSDL